MDVWTLSVEADAAVFTGVLFGDILAIATLIRPNGAHTKNFYTQLMSARRLACAGGKSLSPRVASQCRTASSYVDLSTWSHSPQCTECDHVLRSTWVQAVRR